VIPCEYPEKFTSPETRGIVLPDAENRTIVASSSGHNTGTWRNDGRTDTNGLASTAVCMVRDVDAL